MGCGGGFSVAVSGDSKGCLLCEGRWEQCQGRWELRPDQEAGGCGEARLAHEKARDSDSPVIAQQVHSDEAGLRPSQEAHPAGLSQDWGDRRPGVDAAAAWLRCSTGKGQRYSLSLQAVPKEKVKEALISSFLQ